ncbi:hypothetical protein Ocin01_07835, partial [Orchesella cincta]
FFPGNGLILILLLFYTTTLVHGGYPGRGPPRPPRGPPLLPHHPRRGGGPPRSSIFNRKHPPPGGPHPGQAQRRGPQNVQSDLAVAAQTLYDLRGYHHIPLSGPQENPRFHRQNDPFTLPTPLASNQRPRGVHQDTRTAPLVFPSFYQEQPTPTPTRSTIFGHNQHLSQTRFEPPAGFHLGGNSASGKITFEQQSSPSGARDHQFRPSQIDISLHGAVQPTPSPSPTPIVSQQHQQQITEKKNNIPNTRTSGSHDSRTRVPVKLSKEQQQDPFVYVYDDVDYEEGEDDFSIGRQRAPQNQINNNRITPSTTTTTAPLRSREPTIVPSSTPYSPLLQQQYHHTPNIYSTTTTKQPTTTQNSLFYSPQKDDYHSARDVFRDHGIIRPPVTPRPNVEIVPSSERKPPPDQSNAIAPSLTRIASGHRDYNRVPQQVPVINDDHRFRRPTQSTTTTSTASPPPPQQIQPQFQRENIFHHQQQQQYQQQQPPQGRQVPQSPPQSVVPYFPAGLDRRPFETNNNERPSEDQRQRNHFDQVVNLLQEEEEEFPQNNFLPSGPSNIEQSFNNPSKLRPVNTLIPKNRIPKEDILLPPNFPYLNSELTTTLTPIREENTRVRGDPTHQRVRENQVTRIREEIPTRIRDEVPRVPQRVNPTQAPVRTRPPLVIHEDINENIINNQNAAPPPPPSRVRGQTIRQPPSRTTTTTTTTTPSSISADLPPRGRTASPRQRLRPNYRLTTTTSTTTTTTTTPTPTFAEYPSQEYLDEYDNPQQQYQQSPAPPQVLAPVVVPQSQQPISRFPPFPKKNTTPEEFPTTSAAPPPTRQRERPTERPVLQEVPRGGGRRQRPNKGNGFRETTTLGSTTSPRTTGKPLYTTGKMLSKEGGLYAGQRITSSHVYGHPVPNMPINSVLDRVPGVLDGKVILATTKPSFASPQKHLRSKQRNPDHGPPSRINHSQQRLRPAPTPRPALENSLDIVETVTLRPYQDEKGRPSEEPKRIRPGSQFIRGQQNIIEKERDGQAVLPRRRKVRPGQRRQQSTSSAPEPFTETVSIHSTRGDSAQAAAVEEESTAFQTDRAHIIRETVTPNSGGAQHNYETTTQVQPSPSPRSRRPRPRPGNKQNFSEASNVSERSREREAESSSDEPQRPQKPVRKLRPRLRPVPQLNPQQQRGLPSEVVTQSSAQIDWKPTDAPGRFSSRFREESFGTTTISAPTQSLRGEDDEREPSRFSPPTARPVFKPPPPKKVQGGRRKPQQSTVESEDDLPDSIRLSPKDVIVNRKPARRIPPGSASDRLKALQQRRKKVFSSQQQASEPEQAAEGRQVPVRQGFNKRPRKPLPLPIAPEQNEEESQQSQAPPPQAQRLRRPQPSEESSGAKREIAHRPIIQLQSVKINNDEDDDDENVNEKNNQDNEDNSEYDNEDLPPSPPPQPRVTSNRPPRVGQGFYRNKSIEVTSDEARSVLGIPRPAAPYRPPGIKKQQQRVQNFEDEEEEEEDDQEQEQQNSRFQGKVRNGREGNDQSPPEFNTNVQPFQQQKVHRERPRPIQQQQQRQEEPEQEEEQANNNSEYDEDEPEEREEAPPQRKHQQQHKKHYVSTTSVAPQQILRKQLNTIQSGLREPANEGDEEDEQQQQADEEEQEEEEERNRRFPEQATTVTTSSTTSSSTSSSISPSPTTPSEPVQLAPVRSGPVPIKQGALKLRARLRPNKKVFASSGGGGNNGGAQPRVSVSQSSTSTTEATASTSKERKQHQQGLKHGVIHVSKALRPRLSSSTQSSGRRSSKKFVAMATENPSLPLESIFPEVA